MTSMDLVFEAIKCERERQDLKYGFLDQRNLSVAEYILIIEDELREAKEGLLRGKTDEHSALNEIKQVAASAVACLQRHGLKGNGK